tara:strand:- start:337 stop:1080 length:744 start_codon:yes stop_codon:yes gene_type:complete
MRSKDKYIPQQNKIFVAVRSYNRPEYLKETLDSLANTDLTQISRLWIYDDGSTDKNTRDILKQHPIIDEDITSVILNTENKGCDVSYIDLLDAMKDAHKSGEYFCIIDNDVQIAPNAFIYMKKAYDECRKVFSSKSPVLLSGFYPSNAHKDEINFNETYITSNKYFKERYCVGAVCYMFDEVSYPTIYRGWETGLDWGICEILRQNKGHMCVTTRSVVNHIGEIGLHSKGKGKFDTDDSFDRDLSIL